MDVDVLDRLDAAVARQERLEAMVVETMELVLMLAERLGVYEARPALRLIDDGQASKLSRRAISEVGTEVGTR